MSTTRWLRNNGLHFREKCDSCNDQEPALQLRGYAEHFTTIELCTDCALQLARKLLEDVCDVASRGGRHG